MPHATALSLKRRVCVLNLQQRILQVLGSHDSCLAADVYSSLGPNTESGAIDCALGGLIRANKVSRDLNCIAALEAQLAVLRVQTVRRERFFQEYEALAEGAG